MKVGMIATHPLFEGGVSTYTANLMNALQQRNVETFLFSNRLNTPEVKEDKRIIPCWDRGPLYPFQILRALTGSKIDLIHIQHEFFLFGGTLSALMFPVLLFFLKFLRKPIIITVHGVIAISSIDKDFMLSNESNISPFLFKLGMGIFTRITTLLSDALIVHGECFKKTLINEYGCPPDKISVIPHPIGEANRTKVTRSTTKNNIDLKNKVVILFFGYLSWYKGLKTLIEAFKQKSTNHPNWILVIAGGEHPRLKLDTRYQRYVSGLKNNSTSKSNQIIFTDYIEDGEIPLFFSTANIIVFPYTISMSSSGPFALAATYRKPFIVSNIELFTELVPIKELRFRKDSLKDLGDKLEKLIEDPELQKKAIMIAEDLAMKNSTENIGIQTASLYKNILEGRKGQVY